MGGRLPALVALRVGGQTGGWAGKGAYVSQAADPASRGSARAVLAGFMKGHEWQGLLSRASDGRGSGVRQHVASGVEQGLVGVRSQAGLHNNTALHAVGVVNCAAVLRDDGSGGKHAVCARAHRLRVRAPARLCRRTGYCWPSRKTSRATSTLQQCATAASRRHWKASG